MKEEWRDVPGYAGYYQVSDRGRVRSLDRKIKQANGRYRLFSGMPLKPFDGGHGYHQVTLWKAGQRRTTVLHQLVAEIFIGKQPDRYVVHHKDGNIINNSATNLTYMQKRKHIEHHTVDMVRGENHPNTKLTNAQVLEIKKLLGEKNLEHKEIGKLYGTSRPTITAINNKRNWGWLIQSE